MTAPLPPTPPPAPFGDATGPAVDLAQVIRVIWVGKGIIALGALMAVLVVGYYGFIAAAPRHAADVVIDTQATTPPATATQMLLATATLEQVIATLDLDSDPAFNRYLAPQPALSLRKLRTALRHRLQGTTDTPPSADAIAAKLVENLRAGVRVVALRDSDLLRITVTTGDPARAVAIAAALADTYLADQITQQRQLTAATLAAMDARIADLRAQVAQIQARIAQLPPLPGADQATALTRAVADTAARLQSSTAALARSTDSANRQRLGLQVAALDADHTARRAQYDAQARVLADHAGLQADLDATSAQLAADLALRGDIALQAAQITAPARIITAATQARYVGPQKLLLLQIAALTGALAGAVIVLARQALRRGFGDARALGDATGLPVLAQMPLLANPQPGALIATLNATRATAGTEAFRDLRTALLMAGAAPPQVIVSTSAVPGEGKTTQAIGLAHSLAMLGKSVLLVDGDLRQGTFGGYFDLTQGDGLAAVVLGHIPLLDACAPSAIPGVDLLAGGAPDAGAAEFLFRPALGDVIAQARRQYDHVVIDAPPVGPVPDALALAAHADAVLFAVRWEHTRASVVQAATARLAAARISITGLTLTRVNTRKQAQHGGIGFARFGRSYFQA